MDDLISRQAAIDKFVKLGDYYNGRDEVKRGIHQCIAATYDLPSAQPELIEKAAYIRGFEQGRTQGMIDSQQQWTPCSEGSPEKEGVYFVTLPTADVVEVVRCKDCKYDHKCSHNIIRPSKGGGIIYCPLEYCSEGERA